VFAAASILMAGIPAVHAQQPSQPPAAVSPPPPAPVGLTGQFAPWLQVRAEFRERVEGFGGGAFRADNDDGYFLNRFRFNATVAPSSMVKVVVQLQDARAFEKSTGQMAAPVRNTLDLRMAYGQFGAGRHVVRAGRQELAFGEQRLIGHLNWVNSARSFDAVRATIARTPFTFDVFAASVVTIRPDTSSPDAPVFSESGGGNALYGFYGSTTSLLPKATVEPYVFYRQSRGLRIETGGTGTIHQTTTGTRLVGKLPSGFDYGVEMAWQTGSVATDAVNAWAGHWVVGRAFTAALAKPRSFLEFNYASGDAHPTDGTRGTFDQLYPTGHDKYGLADQVGWKNVQHLRGGIELKPWRQWQVSSSYHAFWLASATDALYAANGAAVARSVAGTAGRFVGQEVDVQAAYTYSPQLQIGGGYATLAPGEFLKNTTPGASYRYGYLTVTYVFVGDQPVAARKGGQR